MLLEIPRVVIDRNFPIAMGKAGNNFLKYSVHLKDAQETLLPTC
jgi:hypothetical protein